MSQCIPMARPRSEETRQITLRLPLDLLKPADAYAAQLDAERPGMRHNWTDAIRIAFASHFPPLPEQAPPSAPAKPSPAKRTAKRRS